MISFPLRTVSSYLIGGMTLFHTSFSMASDNRPMEENPWLISSPEDSAEMAAFQRLMLNPDLENWFPSDSPSFDSIDTEASAQTSQNITLKKNGRKKTRVMPYKNDPDKKEKNRLAARRSRQKKTDTIARLTRENQRLKEQVEAMALTLAFYELQKHH